MYPGDRGRPGFTLIELLVVISVIALLIGILLPVLGKARVAARTAACKSNQRQLMIATAAYQADNREFFPQPEQDGNIPSPTVRAAAVWFNALDPYLNQQRLSYSTASPSDRNYREFKQCPAWNDFPADVRELNRTIKMNAYLGHGPATTPPGGPTVRFYRDVEIRRPSEVVLYGDGRAYDTPSVTTGNVDGDEFYLTPTYIGLRHDGGANLTHVDGHVAHQRNPTYLTAAGYVAWFADTDPVPENRPESTFNFRP